MKTITDDDWIFQYKPVLNHIQNDPEGSWGGCLFETYGADLDYVVSVANTNEAFVWTLIECDGIMSITSGYHLVNRFGYFITELPADADFIDVLVDQIIDEEEDLEDTKELERLNDQEAHDKYFDLTDEEE